MYVLGWDAIVDMVLLSLRALVEWFDFINPSRLEIVSWVRDSWKSPIRNLSRVMTLDGGWTIFHFLSEEDRAIN